MISVSVDTARLQRSLRQLGQTLDQGVEDAFSDAVGVFASVLRRQSAERVGSTLADSWKVELRVGRDGMRGSIKTTEPYAVIQSRGGVVRAKSGYLAVPLLGQVGRVREDPTPMAAWRSRRGNLLLWDVSRGAPEPRYLLVKQVQLPPSNYLDVTIQASQTQMEQAIQRALKEVM